MIAIVKAKVTRSGNIYSSTAEFKAKNVSLIWVYKSDDKIKVSKSGIKTYGYMLTRKGKESDQYAIDLSFDGKIKKDMVYLAIEKEIKPLIRDWQLNELLEN